MSEEEDLSNFEDNSDQDEDFSVEIETKIIEPQKDYQVLSKDSLIETSKNLIEQVKSVCNLSRSVTSALLRKFE